MIRATVDLRDFERRMSALDADVRTKIGQSANRAGAVAARKAIETAAPTGPLAEGAQVRRKRKNGNVRLETHKKLKNHVKVRKGRAASATEVRNSIYSNSIHASMLEFGSVHTPATHWFTRALVSANEAILIAMAKSFERQLRKKGI